MIIEIETGKRVWKLKVEGKFGDGVLHARTILASGKPGSEYYIDPANGKLVSRSSRRTYRITAMHRGAIKPAAKPAAKPKKASKRAPAVVDFTDPLGPLMEDPLGPLPMAA